ncbi:branched-chain amino acid transaminase [Candidatus Marsarchaeota archaeon]|nr:branched-chain amino acid transaminase [Candidatus Marsarchaeota archaeon]MCL5404738.1 branched-chain amino acid transaminase [Candidatus Marsarchaeota archaeon]
MKDKNFNVWLDGKLVPYGSAVVPILTHSLQYGSGIFEGIRSYSTPKGAAIFRLPEHLKRFMQTAKIYSMDLNRTERELADAIKSVIRSNKLEQSYIRPFAFYNEDEIGINAYGKKVSVFIAAVPFGKYFGSGMDKGIRCKVSSWRRINSEILPVRAKASGNYINSIIASNEAKAAGFDEAILLSGEYIAEGPGENIFLVRDGKLFTPNQESDILLGITRYTLITIARDLGIEVVESKLHREELYTADEVFFSGTAAEITPITSVDGIPVSDGKVGPITKKLAAAYMNVVTGKDKKYAKWLTFA